MPSAQEILEVLNAISNKYEIAAVVWHAIMYFLIILIALRWKPSKRLFLSFFSLPLFSVAFFAWSSGNPFNGTLFTLQAAFVLINGLRASTEKIIFSEKMFVTAGIIMLVFGLVYPHFLETVNIFKYLYASPFGLIPCPTLSVVIGFMLVFRGFGSKHAMLILTAAGLFYGLFGVFKLGVNIDVVLIFGALMMGVGYVRRRFF